MIAIIISLPWATHLKTMTKLQNALTWVLDELERILKKENHQNLMAEKMDKSIQVQLYSDLKKCRVGPKRGCFEALLITF